MTGPSPFYQQHFSIEAPAIDERTCRPWFRLVTGLDQLHDDKTITEFEFRAARAFGFLAATVMASDWPTAPWLGSVRANTRGGFEIKISRREEALNRLHAIRQSLGRDDFALLEAHVVHDFTWTEIARRLAVHPKTAKTRTIAAIRALAAVIWEVT